MNTVELFSGTRSFSKVAEKLGHNTFCVEIDERFSANLHKDILDVTPELLNITQEKAMIEGGEAAEDSESALLTGYCDQCDRWSGNLSEINGNFLCEECQIELKGEY